MTADALTLDLHSQDALDAALLAMLDIAEQGHGADGNLSEQAKAQIDRIAQMAQEPKKLLAGEVPEVPQSPDTEEKSRTPPSGWRSVHRRIMRQFGRQVGTTQKMLTQEQTLAVLESGSVIASSGWYGPFLNVQNVRQIHNYDCGAACTHSVALYFDVAGKRSEADFIRELDTQPTSMIEDGTRWQHIVGWFEQYGVAAHGQADMTLEDLRRNWKAGIPTITPIQDYGSDADFDANESGHYVVVCGFVGRDYLVIQDPSAANAEAGGRLPDHFPDSVQDFGKLLVRASVFESVWHDQDATGTILTRFGIAVGPPHVHRVVGTTAKSWTPDTAKSAATGGTGGVERPERTSDPKLGDDMRRVELMADILGGLLGKKALLAFAGEDVEDAPGDTEKAYGVFEDRDSWQNWLTRRAWDELQHPRGKGGRFIKKGSAESYAAAKVAIRQTLRDRAKAATPEHAQKLAELMSILTVKQLHELKREHGLQASGRLREQLIAKLVDRLPGAQERMDKERQNAAKELGLAEEASLEDIVVKIAEDAGYPEHFVTKEELEEKLTALGVSVPVLRGEAMQHAFQVLKDGLPAKKPESPAEEKPEAEAAENPAAQESPSEPAPVPQSTVEVEHQEPAGPTPGYEAPEEPVIAPVNAQGEGTPPVQDGNGEPVPTATAERPTTGKTDSGETVRLGRIKPVEPITFAQPIAGPSGAKLLGYTWQYKPHEEYNDRTGEIETRRVSDWEKAERNIETGRDVVHHFTIQGPDGKRQTVSLETALQKMGYGGGKEGGGAIKTLASSVKTLAKNRMELQIAEARKATYDTAITEAKSKIAEMPQPKVQTEESPDGRGVRLRMGDASIFFYRNEYERSRALKIPEEKLQLLRSSWEQRRIDELVPKEIRDLKYGSSSAEAIADLKKRIARAEAKVKSAVDNAAKSSSEAVSTATATPPEPGFTGEDALGRKWVDGKLVAAEKNPQGNSPTAIDESGRGSDNTSGGGVNAQKPEEPKMETTTRHPGLQSVYEELAKREASPKYASVRAKLEAMTPDEQAALAAYVAEGGGSRAKKVLERIAEGKPPTGMTQEQATAAEQARKDAAMAPERARREAEEKERQAKRETEEKEARARLEEQRAKDEAARRDRERKQADAAAIETQATPFRRAIAMNPIDDSARLIFADWLEEHGRSAEAHDQRAMATPAPKSKSPIIPPKQPHSGFETVSWQRMKDAIKNKFLPREPKEGERLLLINRPQNGPYSFVEYNKGEIVMQGDSAYIIVASKPGFTRGGEGWKRWEQLAVARPANATEIAYALAQKKVEQWRDRTKPYGDYHTSGYRTEGQRQEAEEWLRRYEQDPLAAYRAQQESEKR